MKLHRSVREALRMQARARLPQNPLVVGYRGEIGSFILAGLLRVLPKATNIWCIDVNETAQEVKQRLVVADVIFLCVPYEQTCEWLATNRKRLANKVIIEQASLKEWVYTDKRLRGLNILSMHILFRPSVTPNKSDRRCGLIYGQFGQTMTDFIQSITESKIVCYQSPAAHDKEMAVEQALVHRVLLVLSSFLDSGENTFIGAKVRELRDRIRKGDRTLYKAIQANRHLSGVIKEFTHKFANFKLDDFWSKDPLFIEARPCAHRHS